MALGRLKVQGNILWNFTGIQIHNLIDRDSGLDKLIAIQ